MTTDRSANLGQCFIAVNPEMFAPGFSDRLQDLMDFMRKMEPVSAVLLFYSTLLEDWLFVKTCLTCLKV
jgi:hypothetical protein